MKKLLRFLFLLPLLACADTLVPTQAALDALAAQSQSKDVAFLERFGRLTNGDTVEPGDAPEIGNNWRWYYLTTNAYPTIVSGALKAQTNGAYYLGGPAGETITSFAVVVEHRASSNYPSGTSNGGFVIGLAPSTMLSTTPGSPTLPENMLHIRTNRSGIAGLDVGNGGASFTTLTPEGSGSSLVYWGPSNLYTMQLGRKYLIFVEIDTAKHECRVTAMGKTWKYVDSRIGASGPYTDFFIEAESDNHGAASYDSYAAVHSVAINAPQLDQTPGFGTMPYNDALAPLASGNVASLPTAQLRLPGSLDSSVSSSASSDRLLVGGDLFVNGKISTFNSSARVRLPMMVQVSANQLASGASASDASLFQFTNLTLPTNGDSLEYEVQGYFGANGNTKRIKINSSGNGLWFDTGDLTENGTAFVLRFKRTKISGADHSFHGEFQTTATRVVQRASNNNGGAPNSVFTVTGTSAGDITVTSIVGKYNPAGQ